MMKKSNTLAAGVTAAALTMAGCAPVLTPDGLMERVFPSPTAPPTAPGAENALYDAPVDTPAEVAGSAFILLPEGSRIYTDCADITGATVEGEGRIFEVPAPQTCAAFTHELTRISVHSLELPPTHSGLGLDAYVHATAGDFITVTAEGVDADV